jgi:hypothetical protein
LNIPSAVSLAGAMVSAKFAHGLVDHYWSRGAIMIVWASVGMALFENRNSRVERLLVIPLRRTRALRGVEMSSRH